jgi:hypothetical protein
MNLLLFKPQSLYRESAINLRIAVYTSSVDENERKISP